MNVLRLVSIAAATMVALLVLAASASADADYVPGQVVVRYAPGTGPSDRD